MEEGVVAAVGSSDKLKQHCCAVVCTKERTVITVYTDIIVAAVLPH